MRERGEGERERQTDRQWTRETFTHIFLSNIKNSSIKPDLWFGQKGKHTENDINEKFKEILKPKKKKRNIYCKSGRTNDNAAEGDNDKQIRW